MATPKSQRIGILIIAFVMVVGTIGSFMIMILSSQNSQKDVAEQNKILEEYQKQIEEQQKKQSDKYYSKFAKYKNSPEAFNAKKVGSKVKKTDLKNGTGSEIKKGTTYQAYYIGWNPKGKVFDSSFNGKALKAPIDTSATGGLIKGWDEGVIGMKVGGVREITIPSDLAYGENGSGGQIPPNTPIKFIIMIIAADK